MENFSGVYPALVTPFTDTGNLNEQALKKLIAFHLEAGVDGLYVGGTTGEGILQDVPMRCSLSRGAVDYVRGRAKVIVHVAACATDDAVTLARDAAQIGADAVSAVPPIFYKMGFEGIYHYYRTIAEASDLPLIIYHIPVLSGVNFSLDEFGRLFEIPNVCGIKFSDYDLFLLHRIREHYPEVTVFSGNDQVFLPALVMGAHASIGLTLNFMPEVYVGIYRAYQQSDLAEAKRLQFQANRVTEIIIRYGQVGAAKAVLKMLGFDCGKTRSPIMPVEGPMFESLRKELKSVSFFASNENE